MSSFNPIMVEGYSALISSTAVVLASWLRCEARNSWLKLDDCLWLDPPWFNYCFSLALVHNVGILAMSPLHCFIIVFKLILSESMTMR